MEGNDIHIQDSGIIPELILEYFRVYSRVEPELFYGVALEYFSRITLELFPEYYEFLRLMTLKQFSGKTLKVFHEKTLEISGQCSWKFVIFFQFSLNYSGKLVWFILSVGIFHENLVTFHGNSGKMYGRNIGSTMGRGTLAVSLDFIYTYIGNL